MEQFSPKECKQFPGFFEIPSYSRYAVSKDGKVLNKLTGNILNGAYNPAGYHSYRLYNDLGFTYTYGTHRILCDVFKPDYRQEKLFVNHINGIKSDNRVDNLEWTTPKENCEHAGRIGISDKCIPISVRDVTTGIVEKFPSFIECAREYGYTKDTVNWRINNGKEKVYPDGRQYRKGHSDKPWPDVFIDNELLSLKRVRPLFTKNLETGKIKAYRRMLDLANELGVALSTLSQWLNNSHHPVIPGMLQIKFADDRRDWRFVEDPLYEIEMFQSGRSVQVTNEKTNEIIVYPSANKCAVANNIKPTALNYRLQFNGEKVFKDGKRYKYMF